jgi:hypothetical protein
MVVAASDDSAENVIGAEVIDVIIAALEDGAEIKFSVVEEIDSSEAPLLAVPSTASVVSKTASVVIVSNSVVV